MTHFESSFKNFLSVGYIETRWQARAREEAEASQSIDQPQVSESLANESPAEGEQVTNAQF